MQETARWLKDNSLQFNGEKTEIVCCAAKKIPSVLLTNFWPMPVDKPLTPSKAVRNLGVVIDDRLSLETQVNKTAGTSLSLIMVLRKILPMLPDATRAQIVRSVVLSRLDYCNALLLEAPKHLIERLQRSQTMAAKLVLRKSRRSSASLALKELHWLPVAQRVQFKALCVVFKTLHGMMPKPLQHKFNWYVPTRSLCSSSAKLIKVPKFKRTNLGGRAFSAAAARLWNALPNNLRQIEDLLQFRKKLKTWLFPNDTAYARSFLSKGIFFTATFVHG